MPLFVTSILTAADFLAYGLQSLFSSTSTGTNASTTEVKTPYSDTKPGQVAGASKTTLPDLELFRAALADLSKVAIVNSAGNLEFTYGQLLHDAVELRRQLGVVDIAGARVAFLIPRSYEYAVVQWATWAAGGIAVPLCDAHPPPELEYVITDSQAAIIVIHKSFAAKFTSIKEKLPQLRWIELEDYAVKPLSEVTAVYRTSKFDDERGALLVYTSGTTGKPKGCLTTHNNVKHQVLSLVQAWKWTKNDRILHVLPLHHIHGIINVSAWAKQELLGVVSGFTSSVLCSMQLKQVTTATVFILQVLTCSLWSGATVEMEPKFDAKAIWQRWKSQQNLTLFMAVPTIYAKLTQAYHKFSDSEKKECTAACKQFRLMVSGSAALPEQQFQEWEVISGHKLLERFGMTEIGMGISNPLEGVRRPGCVGLPLPYVSIKIISDEDKDVTTTANQPGMLYVRGPIVFKEYWGRPEATASSFKEIDGQKYFITGDYAQMTNDGVYKIMGRASSDIIKTGGYKVSALEIEHEILNHPDVQECAVVGVPNAEWGEQVVAVVVLKQGTKPFELKEFRDWLKPKIATYKIPAQLKFVNELPRNVMLK
ncbi:hypothetical protein SmJEL517_g00793 [Synchytrium microbalum]|uniref:AMP-dependent synthetase/ligase domain-containing protein n=1 Tax=Synchytrium microbalum TaxID=1806994 RepID=A0A507CC28_9FUNG|nr:uncharacterized protein SmJEL517_g00793 [Synchytrium microbalum]TPX37172.1 hypothetical protein SmJEL517_g00793 [Synchytrium microbalum]